MFTPYQRIMRAAAKGRGASLSADEIRALSMDDAILTRAQLDDDASERPCAECGEAFLSVRVSVGVLLQALSDAEE